jgi:hypothetical protein
MVNKRVTHFLWNDELHELGLALAIGGLVVMII